jgi:hypothetical protein
MNALRSGIFFVFIVAALVGFISTVLENRPQYPRAAAGTETMSSDLEGSTQNNANQDELTTVTDELTTETEINSGLPFLLHKPPHFRRQENWPLLVRGFTTT